MNLTQPPHVNVRRSRIGALRLRLRAPALPQGVLWVYAGGAGRKGCLPNAPCPPEQVVAGLNPAERARFETVTPALMAGFTHLIGETQCQHLA